MYKKFILLLKITRGNLAKRSGFHARHRFLIGEGEHNSSTYSFQIPLPRVFPLHFSFDQPENLQWTIQTLSRD